MRLRYLLMALIIIFGCISCQRAPEDLARSDKYRLVWNNDPTSTITIAWDQRDTVSTPAIYYGEKDYGRKYWKYKNKQGVTRICKKYDMHTHFAQLSGLTGNTAYYFVIKDEQGVSKRYWFKTAPETPQPFTFIVGGDTKSYDEPLVAGRNSNRMVAKLRPLFVIFNGDFTSGNGTSPVRWKRWLRDWHELTTTNDGRMIPIVPVHGNHENGDMANLSYIFDAPCQDDDSTKVYYSLSFGDNFFHMILLNSEINVGGLQKDWLNNDLEQHQDYTFKIAGYHKPFFPHTSGKSENHYQYTQWAYLFYQYGLDVSFDGDSHMHKLTYPLKPDTTESNYMGFIRDDENGTLFAGEGSWGAKPRPNDDDKPWTLTSGSFNQVKWIHILPESKEEDAHMKIFTVLTADYDENGNLIRFNQNIEPLTETNLFEIPQDIKLHMDDSTKQYIRYPYSK